MFTWQDWSQAVRGSAGGDASDDAVKQEADSLSFWTGQEENTSPWKNLEKKYICEWKLNKNKTKHDGVGKLKKKTNKKKTNWNL